MNKKEMVRYSRVNGREPKNTLYTFRENNLVYFGISRCDLKSDNFQRVKGTTIAKHRAEKAKEEQPLDWYRETGYNNEVVFADDAGLRGVVPVESVGKLLEHFNGIDEFAFKNTKAV